MNNSGSPSPEDREAVLFALALDQPVAQRTAFLQAVCDADNALRQRLEALLAAHEQPDELLENTAHDPTAKATVKNEFDDAPSDEAVGQTLGRYKLLERLGEGGCGVVYVAEQTEPVRRRVALKVIKLGMDTKQVVARFEAERQALAMMDHPNIAKVLDAGTTGARVAQASSPASSPSVPLGVASGGGTPPKPAGEDARTTLSAGRPYFVMELVRGIKITDYCDQAQLSTKQRLDLFIKVCQAIQHAHQKGIIHRDVKPSNILVTLHDGVPVPKVIDFGIAKATEGRLTDATVYTQLHQFIGTPAYMSPEQAEMSGLDIDTRSDIYSLGVLLYELLTGKTPFDARELMSQGLDAMRKTIREREPLRPSTRLTQELVAASRQSAANSGENDSGALPRRRYGQIAEMIRVLRGDLDWIVMKCLEKDRSRRYETANGLAADLKRHLANEPVTARPPSTNYRLRKAIRRNKLTVIAASGVASALFLGFAASTWQAIRASRAERVQRSLREDAEAARANEAAERVRAEAATASESKLRQAALVLERKARLRAYAADLNLAHHAIEQNDIGRAQELLDRYRPSSDGEDLRGWEWRYLWRFCRSDAQFRLYHRPQGVWQISISHDGRWLVGGAPLVYLDLDTRQLATPPWKPDDAFMAVFSPTESLVAAAFVGTRGSELRLFDTATGQPRWALTNVQASLRSLQFSADGSVLIGMGSGSSNGQFELDRRLWRVTDGHTLARIKTPALPTEVYATASALTVDRRSLIIPDPLSATTLVSLEPLSASEQWRAEIKAKVSDNMIFSIALSPDSRWLAVSTGTGDGTIYLFDAQTGREAGRLEGHLLYVIKLMFLDHGRVLASASADRTIRLWNFHERKLLGILRGHREEVRDLAAMPDGRTLVSSSFDGEILVWDRQAYARRPSHVTLPGSARFWQFTEDNAAVVGLGQAGEIVRWSGRDLGETKLLAPALQDRSFILLSDDAETAIWISMAGSIFAQDLREPLHEPRLICRQEAKGSIPLQLLPGRNQLLTERHGGGESRVDLWDVQSGRLVRSWPLGEDRFSCVVYPDGTRILALNGQDGKNRMLDVMNGGQVELGFDQLPPFPSHYPAAFTRDGRVLAAPREPHLVRLWQFPSFNELPPLKGHMMGGKSVAFSPDGRRIVTASSSFDALKLWDAESQLELLTLATEGSYFTRTRFSSDGNRIGTGNPAGLVHIWAAPSWEDIASVQAKDKAGIKQP